MVVYGPKFPTVTYMEQRGIQFLKCCFQLDSILVAVLDHVFKKNVPIREE